MLKIDYGDVESPDGSKYEKILLKPGLTPKGMTREELWEEFENQLIRETLTSIIINFDTAERMTKLGIKETVALEKAYANMMATYHEWKDRLEQEPCEDAVSRKAVVEYIEGSDVEKLEV